MATTASTQAELAAELRAAAVRQNKTIEEIKVVQGTVTALNTEVERLNALIAAGGAITQELVNSANEVTRLSELADDQIPDPPVVIPPTEPA